MPIERKMLSNAIENAQRRVESRNFQARKNVLEYDNVMNKQRTLIYDQRRKVLDGEDLAQYIQSMIEEVVADAVGVGFAGDTVIDGEAQLAETLKPLEGLFLSKGEVALPGGGFDREGLEALLIGKARAFYAAKEKELGPSPDGVTPMMRELERVIMLRVVDEYWMEHIDAMDDLRDSVRLRAHSQINPVDEYKREGFDMFEEMVAGIKEEVVRRIFVARVRKEEGIVRRGVARNVSAQQPGAGVGGDPGAKAKPVRRAVKIGRNEPCPCGKLRPNGLRMKYKDCCGRDA
jgi:preprotein translocase subunit SecA